jgi:hypothetical protein
MLIRLPWRLAGKSRYSQAQGSDEVTMISLEIDGEAKAVDVSPGIRAS